MIQLHAIEKLYGKQPALQQIDLTIPKASSFGLVGPNGAGKSTLMKILVGVIEDYKGQIKIDSAPYVGNQTAMKQRIGYVPQDICLEETLTARDNLILFGRLYGVKGKKLQERMNAVLELIGLKDREKSLVTTFSGGMKRRLNIGCALLHDPDIVILDEPTVGVDPQSRRAIFEMIHSFKNNGKTVIYSSHYMEEVEQLCDHIGFIDRGVVIEQGKLRDVLARHRQSSIYVEGKGISKQLLTGFEGVTEHEEGYLIESQTPLQTLEAVTCHLAKKAILPARLELSQAKLEDIFIKLTGTPLRDNGWEAQQ